MKASALEGRKQRSPWRLREKELTEGKRMFKTLEEAVVKPKKRELARNSWIRGGTWQLIDRRTSLRREGRLTRAEGRRLGRQIKAALKADRIE